MYLPTNILSFLLYALRILNKFHFPPKTNKLYAMISKKNTKFAPKSFELTFLKLTKHYYKFY